MTRLWKCPLCGIEGRLAHRYASSSKLDDLADVGECPTGRDLEVALIMQARRHAFVERVITQALGDARE